MGQQLYLNGLLADLPDKPITRKIAIGDISDITSRKSSYSYTVSLPMTSRNKSLFDLLGVSGNTSKKPFENVVANYVVDSVTLVSNGSIVIRETNTSYDVNIIDGVKGLADILGQKKLVDLPLSDLDHTLNTQTYVNSYSNTSGYIYGIANFGKGVDSDIKVESQAPSIYTHTLFRRIFEDVGLVLTGDFFAQSDNYLSEVVTPSKGYYVEPAGVSIDIPRGSCESDELSDYEYSQNPIPLRSIPFTISDIDLENASIVGGNIVFSQAGVYILDIDIDYGVVDTYAYVEVLKGGNVVAFLSIPEGTGVLNEKLSVVVDVGDVYSFNLNVSSIVEIGEPLYYLNYVVSLDIALSQNVGGQLIRPSDYMGDMTQIDFVKDVMNRYGLLIDPVSEYGQYRFKTLESVLSDVSTAEDWTSKLSGIDSENYKSGYAQINNAVFQYPETIISPNNDGILPVVNYNAEKEKPIITSPFEIPNEDEIIGNAQTYLIPIWGEEVDGLTIERRKEVANENNDVYINNLGDEISSDNWVVRRFDNIDEANKNYKAVGATLTTDSVLVCGFDSQDNLISLAYPGTGQLIYYNKRSFEVSYNVSYMKIAGVQPNLPELYEYEEITGFVNKNEETPLKVMHVNRLDQSITATFFDEVEGITVTENVPFLNLDFVSMQYVIDNYYASLRLLLNNYKKVNFKLNLSLVDIVNLDFFKLKYIKHTGKYYYLNSVQNTTGKVSKVEMLEITEFK